MEESMRWLRLLWGLSDFFCIFGLAANPGICMPSRKGSVVDDGVGFETGHYKEKIVSFNLFALLFEVHHSVGSQCQ
jgi:hypothetical protein